MKYKLDRNTKGVIDTTTGESIFPSCYVDLEAYCSYFTGKNELIAVQNILHKVFMGEKLISEVIETAQTRVLK